MLIFSTPAHTSNNNNSGPAIRWGTMANVRFDADAAPVETDGQLGLWRSGPGAGSNVVSLKAPDCEDNPCPADMNGDGTVNVDDLLAVVAEYGTPGGDVIGDGFGDVDDILVVWAAFGTDC
jgi:hypothetical protein